MKKIALLVITLIFIKASFAQREEIRSFEPAKIKVVKTYNTPAKLNIDIFIKDSRTSSKLFSEKVVRAIGNYIKESYPHTKINLIRNIRKDFNPEPNKILVRIDVVDYFVVRKTNKWIAKTTIDITIFDLRGNKVKRYKEKISNTANKPNRNGVQSAKLALNSSFKAAVVKSINYIEKSVRGEGKYELVQRPKQSQTTDNNPVINESIDNEKPVQEITTESTISNVDINIPTSSEKIQNRYALIIGNEDYNSYQKGLTNEVNVEFAERDAKIFKEYAEKIFGIPDENIILMTNAQVVEFSKAIEKMNVIAKNLDGEAEIYFYYAGHGFPDEETKEPYLIPVDVSGTDLEYAIKLNDVYKKLTEYPVKRVTVFLDACFSGGARNQGLLAARGVKVQPKENLLKGNLVVFTASSGTQSSLPYKGQQHGLFTYYLLKKLQETKGEISLSELADYLNKQVAIKSVMINDKEQNPQVNISPDAESVWKDWTIK